MPDALKQDEPDFDQELTKQKLLDYAFKCREESKAFFDSPLSKTGVRGPWQEMDYFCAVNASESFSAADLQVLKDTKRPNIDPPFAAGVLDAVVGAEIAQETEPVFQGVDKGWEDAVIADWLTQLLRNGLNLAGFGEKGMEAFSDKLVGGYGFVQFYLDLHRIPFRIMCRKLPFWQVWPDPDAIEPNLKDARYWLIECPWEAEDAKANWSSAEQRAAIDNSRISGRKEATSSAPKSGGTSSSNARRRERKNSVTILEFQYRRAVARARYADPETDEEIDATKAKYEERKAQVNAAADELLDAYDAEVAAAEEEYQAQLSAWQMLASSPDAMMAAGAGPEPEPPMLPEPPDPPRIDEEYEAQFVTFYNGYSYRRAFICGESSDVASVLEDKEIDLPLPGDEPGFTIKVDTGYGWQMREEQRVRRFGLMRKIVHIQEWFTKFLQMYIEALGRKIKDGGFYELGAFEGVPGGPEKFIQNSSRGGWWQAVTDGALAAGKIKQNPALQGEPGLLEGVNVMKELFSWVTGVSQALQGTQTSDRSNVLTENLQAQGLQMLLPIRRPRKEFLLSCGRLYAAIAIKHLPAEQIDRILGVQEVEGLTVQKQVNPQTGQPALGPNGKPVMGPVIGEDGQPMTAGKILKQVDLLDFDLTADVSAANQTEKLKFMQVYQQHGLGQVLSDALPGPEGAKIWVPRLLANLPLPATDAKAMAAEAEALLDKMANQQTQEGIVSAFQEILASDPQGAQQLHEQLMALVEQQAPPEDPGAQPQA